MHGALASHFHTLVLHADHAWSRPVSNMLGYMIWSLVQLDLEPADQGVETLLCDVHSQLVDGRCCWANA